MSVEIGRLDPSAATPIAGGARSAPDNEDVEPRPDEERPEPEAEPSSDRARALLERLAESGPNVHARLSIDLDKEAGAFVYRILDSRSGEVMRQFPAEKILELMRYLGEHRGLVVDRKV